MRQCGTDVREIFHDGCAVVCVDDAPFAYVNVFTSHVNLGFFHGASLTDPAKLLSGSGKYMRHVRINPDTFTNDAAVETLVVAAYRDIAERLQRERSK